MLCVGEECEQAAQVGIEKWGMADAKSKNADDKQKLKATRQRKQQRELD